MLGSRGVASTFTPQGQFSCQDNPTAVRKRNFVRGVQPPGCTIRSINYQGGKMDTGNMGIYLPIPQKFPGYGP